MENVAKWHHGTPTKEEYETAARQLDEKIAELEAQTGEKNPHPFTLSIKPEKAKGAAMPPPARKVITGALLERAKKDERFLAVTCDARGSASLEDFAKEKPDAFIEVGIAEQDAVGIAAGLAVAGKIPFVCSPACFLAARSYEQVKTDLSYTGTNVKLLGVSGGVGYGTLGMTHHSLQDIAVMRTLPNMHVVLPCDAKSAKVLAEYAMDTFGPFYIRVGREAVEDVYTEEQARNIKPEKAFLLKEGKHAAILSCGVMTKNALDAANELEKEGISVAVFDFHTIKPFDENAVIEAAKTYKKLITVEEGTKAGGLGALVLETLCENPVPVKVLGFPDEPSVYGTPKEIYAHYGLDKAGIARKVKTWLKG